MNASLALPDVLDHALEVCAELIGCQGALVYLWDEEQGRLVVRAASDGYRGSVGAFGLELGEGLTGWTALTRRVGLIPEDPRRDPRYRFVPELGDERFQSVATAPVVGRGGGLIGVLTVHTQAPREFSAEDVALLETIASLVAGAVENAQLHERALRSAEVFRRLAEVSREMTSGARPQQVLQRLALTALELLDAELAVVLSLDEARALLTVETWASAGAAAQRPEPIAAETPWSRLLGGVASVPLADADPLARQVSGAAPRSLFAAPLAFDGRPTGLLCAYALERRTLSAESRELLATIANHAAIALEEDRRRALAERRTRVRELVDALSAGEGPDLGRPHAVVAAEGGGPAAQPELEHVAALLAAELPGSLCDVRGGGLTALVPADGPAAGRLENVLAGALEGRELRAGISEPAQRPSALAAAFRQARLACAVAHAAGGEARVRAYARLGAQRHLLAIAREGEPDALEAAVGRLLERDRARGSALFRTLEAYLECQGQGARAAAALYIHRNTLRQRLARVSELVGRDVTRPEAWFELGLAVRLCRFRGAAAGRPER